MSHRTPPPLCDARWVSRSKHRGQYHLCAKPEDHDGQHQCACGKAQR